MPLVPCDECRRHLRASETACPFCKTTRSPSLVAALAGSALLLAACALASKYGGPPAMETTPPAVDAGTTAPSSPRLGEQPKPEEPVVAPVAKYGGPPRR